MAFKFVCLAVLVAVAQAGLLPAAHHGHKVLIAEHEAPAVYDFAYSVEDPHTKDSKSQQESRKDHVVHGQYNLLEADGIHRRQVAYSGDEHSGLDVDFEYAVEDSHTGDVKSRKESRKGDVVHGQYSLIDADGHRRTVEYTADPHSGFQAVVHREPVQGHVVKAVHVPIAHHVAPVAYHAAPVAHHVVKAVHAVPAHAGLSSVSYSAPAHSYHY